MEPMTRGQVGDAQSRLERAFNRRAITKDEYNARRGRLDGEFEELLRRVFTPSTGWPRISTLPTNSFKANTTPSFSWANRPSLEERVELIRAYTKQVMGLDRIDVASFKGSTDLPCVLIPAPHQVFAYWQTVRDGGTDPGKTLVASNRQYSHDCLTLLESHTDFRFCHSLEAQLRAGEIRPDPIVFGEWRRFASGRAVTGSLLLYELPFSSLWFNYEGEAYSVPSKFVPELLKPIGGLAADLVCLAFLLASEPWMKFEILAGRPPRFDIPGTQIWSSSYSDWTHRPGCRKRGDKLWCEDCWDGIADPEYAALSFLPGAVGNL